MKTSSFPTVSTTARALVLAAVVAMGARGFLVSQTAPAAPPAGGPSDETLRVLVTIQAGNDKFLTEQQALIKRLDELAEQARQLRIFAKRS